MHSTDDPSNSALIEELNELIARHRAVIDLCEEAASRIDDLRRRVLVHELVTHHIREVDELSQWVAELGARPSHEHSVLEQDRTEVRRLGDDCSLVRAVLVEQERLGEAYRRVADHHASFDEAARSLRRVAWRPRRLRGGLTRRLAGLVAN